MQIPEHRMEVSYSLSPTIISQGGKNEQDIKRKITKASLDENKLWITESE